MGLKNKLLALFYLGISIGLGYAFKHTSEYYLFAGQACSLIIAVIYILKDLKK